MISPNLPLKIAHVELREIDTPEEYNEALKWYRNKNKGDFIWVMQREFMKNV